MRKSLLVGGAQVFPLLTPLQTQDRPFVEGEDTRGPYVACKLGNTRRSPFYDWYVFVSPEDVPLMKAHTWSGNICGSTRAHIEIRRRELVDGKLYSIQLNREIWERMGEPGRRSVSKHGHPLDFRREVLSAAQLRSIRRGLTWQYGAWQVQIGVNNKNIYVGRTPSSAEGYRMYNRYLRKLKDEFPHDENIQSIPYNEVTPQF